MRISDFSLVGFSGSRSIVPSNLTQVCSLVNSSKASVCVGCAKGVDEFVRSKFPSAVVFYASSFGVGRSAFARRSVAFILHLISNGGCLISLPSAPCPVGLLPSCSPNKAFSGLGSGTWASTAFAVGSNLPVFLFAPFGVPSNWGFTPSGGGWFIFTPSGSQLSLF